MTSCDTLQVLMSVATEQLLDVADGRLEHANCFIALSPHLSQANVPGGDLGEVGEREGRRGGKEGGEERREEREKRGGRGRGI